MQTILKNSKPDISCIFVNYHSADYLERSLQSLFLFEQDTFLEVVLINNDQSEKEKVRVLQKKFDTELIELFHNPGFASAANRGAEQAKGTILFFINPDTLWQEPLFKKVLKRFQENAKLGVLGIKLLTSQKKVQTQNSGRAIQFFHFFPFRNKISAPDWVSGGALFIAQEKFKIIGGFDERYFLYFEDMDLCVRMKEKGNEIRLEKEIALIHFSGQSHLGKKLQKKYYDQSLYQYTKKYWTAIEYYCLRIVHPIYRFFFPYGRT